MAAVLWVAPMAHGGTTAAPPAQPYDPALHTAVSNCETPKTDVVVEENPIPLTTNQSPISPTTVLGMTKSVTVGGTGATCVFVNVTSTAFAGHTADEPIDVLYVTVWMDGHVGHPAEYQYSGDDGTSGGTRAANFVFK
jgi:hypothetical protein